MKGFLPGMWDMESEWCFDKKEVGLDAGPHHHCHYPHCHYHPQHGILSSTFHVPRALPSTGYNLFIPDSPTMGWVFLMLFC